MPTIKQKKAFTYLVENGGKDIPMPIGKVLMRVGYSPAVVKTPQKVTESKGFQELMDEFLPDDLLAETHKDLLGAKFIDHMVFPLNMTDEEITELVESAGGVVRKFKHGETQTHVWFWFANQKIRLDAIKLGYQVKGKMADGDGRGAGTTNNTFIQNNTINPNAPKARQLADEILKGLMEKTKRKVVDSTSVKKPVDNT